MYQPLQRVGGLPSTLGPSFRGFRSSIRLDPEGAVNGTRDCNQDQTHTYITTAIFRPRARFPLVQVTHLLLALAGDVIAAPAVSTSNAALTPEQPTTARRTMSDLGIIGPLGGWPRPDAR